MFSKKLSLFVLGITSLACSRLTFLFIDDPEGPNLLIVVALAVFIYFLSITPYLFGFPKAVFRKVLVSFFIQILLTIGLSASF